jgi:hypothetical protein
MKVKVLLPIALFAIASGAQAQNVGKCGVGSKLFAGQRGIAPQVMAITTNAYSGQTFAITSGTSGCTQNGVVSSSWKTAMFIDSNMTKLAKDISTGEGETLDALAGLIGIDSADTTAFKQTLKSKYSEIFVSSETSSEEVVASLKSILRGDSRLTKYAAAV